MSSADGQTASNAKDSNNLSLIKNDQLIEMGIRNDGYHGTERPSALHNGRDFSPYAVDTPTEPSKSTGDGLPLKKDSDPTYLTAADGSHGHQYEDLTQLAAKIQEDHKLNSSSGGQPRKKANVFYETNPADIRDYRSKGQATNNNKATSLGSDLCCLRLMIAILFCFVLLLLLLIVLVIVGTVKIQELDCQKCTSTGTQGSTGANVDSGTLLNRISQLEGNLTAVLLQLNSQTSSFKTISNTSAVQQLEIIQLSQRLHQEEAASHVLNSTDSRILVALRLLQGNLTSLLKDNASFKDSILASFESSVFNASVLHDEMFAKVKQLWNDFENERQQRLIADKLIGHAFNQSLSTFNRQLQAQRNELSAVGDDILTNVTSLIDHLSVENLRNLTDSGLQANGANFSACFSKAFLLDTDIVPAEPEKARVLVIEDILPGHVATGGSCSSQQALHTRLFTSSTSMSCLCEDVSSNVDGLKLECYLHMWLCPASS